MTIEPLRVSFTVACAADHAFTVWTKRTSLWWPADHTTSGTPGSVITFEPRVGGRVVERTASGDELQWGEVVLWEPPSRMAYLWHIGTDRENATATGKGDWFSSSITGIASSRPATAKVRCTTSPPGTAMTVSTTGVPRRRC